MDLLSLVLPIGLFRAVSKVHFFCADIREAGGLSDGD